MQFLFFLFSSIVITSSILVISSRNPVHSLLFLILAFVNLVFLLVLLEAEFLALVFLAVYLGAVAVLFLFVVMMLNIKIVELSKDLVYYLPIGGVLGFLLFVNILTCFNLDLVSLINADLLNQYFYTNWFEYVDFVSTVDYFGQLLYTYYFYFFLLSGLVLLVAMIGAVILTSQVSNKNIREQFINEQVTRNCDNSIFLVTNKNN